MLKVGFPERRARRSRGCPNSRRCATARANQEPRARQPRFLSRGVRAQSRGAGRPCALGADGGRRAAHHRRPLPERRRQDRHQGQVDGRRGDRAQRTSRGERHRADRDRSRRIHHPAPPRAAQPHHRAGGPSDQGAGRRHLPRASQHARLPKRLSERNDLVDEARHVLRQKFLAADVGITGANFLVAETGSSIIVTNEGNGDLTNTLPKMHIVLASIEKVVPTLEDAAVLLRLLARSATGQEFSTYTTLSTGPRRPDDLDGPGAVSRRAARQRPQRAARHRDAGHAALHPLRRLHQSLPGLWRDRRPCLWLGLSRADGRGADAAADRRRGGRATCPMPRPSAAAAKASARCASRCRR